MDRALPPGIPIGTLPIVRSATSATIYTVPAGRRCRLTHAWAAAGGAVVVNNAGTAGLGVLTDLGVARTVVSGIVALSGLDVPIEAGTLVVAVGGLAGIVGYEYTPNPGQEV